jgi:HD-like signal output (HDOD) protein
MTTKSILLAVEDPQAQVDITQALGAGWETTSVPGEVDALDQLEKRSFDAFLVDFNLGSPDASELLNLALEKRPETVRFLFAYEADLALVAAKVLGSFHILPKPVEFGSLKTRLENSVKDSNSEQTASDPVTAPTEAPAVPPVYSDVLKALESPEVTADQVAQIIAGDTVLTSEVLRLTNSSYLGLPSNITDPVEAVESLGLDTVKALVMALQFLAEHSRLKPGYLSLDELWQHSVSVAQIARDLVLFETKDRALAAQALVAGLLHDLGKVVLITNFDDLYGRVHSLARKQPVTLWDIEKEMFGANHGEIGACLVGMWNMPAAVVEAAALHHEPPLGETQQLTPLAAVHVANVLERELQPADGDVMVAPIINTPFLNELGLLQRLPVWRAAFANHRSTAIEELEETIEAPLDSDVSGEELVPAETEATEADFPTATSAQESRTANQLPAPTTPTRTTTSGHPGSGDGSPVVQPARYQRAWVYVGVATVVLALAALWLRTEPELNQTEPVHARTPVIPEPLPVVASTPPPESAPSPAPAPHVTPAVVVAEEPPTVPAASQTVPKPVAPRATTESAPKPAVSVPAPQPAVAAAPAATVTNVPPPTVAPPPQEPMPDFKINGIIYSARPSAIVNGVMVKVGERVNGATVVAIGQTSVTLQFNRQRRSYELQ